MNGGWSSEAASSNNSIGRTGRALGSNMLTGTLPPELAALSHLVALCARPSARPPAARWDVAAAPRPPATRNAVAAQRAWMERLCRLPR
jgi:hypothetical protein